MNELTKKEKEQLETIARVSESVFDSYKLLMELETTDKIKSKEYYQVLECLNTSRKLETSLLSEFTGKADKILSMTSFIKEKIGKNPDEITIMTSYNEQDMPYVRISNSLLLSTMQVSSNIIFPDKTVPEEVKEAIKESLYSLFKFEIDSSKAMIIALNILERDNLQFILNKINQKINDPYYKEIKKYLIKAKYLLIYNFEPYIFLFQSAKELSIPEEIYFYGKIISEKKKIESVYEGIKKKYAFETSIQQLKSILSIKDYEYKYPEKELEMELREIILRLSLQLLSPNEVNNSNEAFHEIIEKDGLEETKSAEFIADAYRKYKKDQASIKTLTLKG